MTKAIAAAAAGLLLLLSCRQATPAKPPDTAKPDLFLISALPIAWGEGFALDQPASPALQALETDYRVRLIDLPSELPDGALLLAAQPRAFPAEELVRLDQWVRRGGRLVLLADPLLEWPSDLPLGDRTRAPIAFADTGLLQHWGLRLDAPNERGPKESRLGGLVLVTASPGTLVQAAGDCAIGENGLTADCRIGKGRAVVIADADFLNLGPSGVDGPTDGNLPALASQLKLLSR